VLDPVYRFPHRIRDMVGARGRGVGGFGEGRGYLFGGEGGIVLIVLEEEKRGRFGFGGKKWWKSVSATSAQFEAPGKSGNICGGRPKANLLAIQREYEVAEDKGPTCLVSWPRKWP